MEKYNDMDKNMKSKPMSEVDGLNSKTMQENDVFDLEQMREQLCILKQKLDKQTIVTDRLIHQAMKQKMSWITKYCWFAALVMFPVICVSWWEVKILWGFSIFSYLLLIILTGGCIVADIVINKMKPADWESENLIQTGVKLAKMKRTRKIQVRIQIVLLAIVFLILGYDTYVSGVIPHEQMIVFGICCLVGLVIGGFAGLRILGKMQRTNDDIIQQIEELTKE